MPGAKARWFDMPQQRGIFIELRREPGHDLPPILGIASEIREALINLIFNAIQAVEGKGKVTIQAGLDERDFLHDLHAEFERNPPDLREIRGW